MGIYLINILYLLVHNRELHPTNRLEAGKKVYVFSEASIIMRRGRRKVFWNILGCYFIY